MRKLIQSSAVLLALSLAAASHAQTAQSADPQGPPHRQFQRRGPNPEFEAKMLAHRLSLTPEQESQIAPILAEQHEQMKALRPAPGTQPDFKALHEQTKAINDSTKEKIEAYLTPDQKEKFEKFHERGFRGPGGPRGQHAPPSGATPSA